MRKYGFHPKLAESTDAKPTDADGPLYFLGKKKKIRLLSGLAQFKLLLFKVNCTESLRGLVEFPFEQDDSLLT